MADRELSEDEVADLKEAFAMFDINGDGMFCVEGFLVPSLFRPVGSMMKGERFRGSVLHVRRR
jgi:hypothetical protein